MSEEIVEWKTKLEILGSGKYLHIIQWQGVMFSMLLSPRQINELIDFLRANTARSKNV